MGLTIITQNCTTVVVFPDEHLGILIDLKIILSNDSTPHLQSINIKPSDYTNLML